MLLGDPWRASPPKGVEQVSNCGADAEGVLEWLSTSAIQSGAQSRRSTLRQQVLLIRTPGGDAEGIRGVDRLS